jgi:hypothetical protein
MNPLDVEELLEQVFLFCLEGGGWKSIWNVSLVCRRWRKRAGSLLDGRLRRELCELSSMSCVGVQVRHLPESNFALLLRLYKFVKDAVETCELLTDTLLKITPDPESIRLVFPRAVVRSSPVWNRLKTLPGLRDPLAGISVHDLWVRAAVRLQRTNDIETLLLAPLFADLAKLQSPSQAVQKCVDRIVPILVPPFKTTSIEIIYRKTEWCDLQDATERAEASYQRALKTRIDKMHSVPQRSKTSNSERSRWTSPKQPKNFRRR